MNISALLAGLLSGISGAMGLGGGTVLIIYLSLFTKTPQLKSQGINLIFFIPCAIIAIILYSKNKLLEWKLALKISVFGILGAFLGLFVAKNLESETVAKIFGIMLIFLGVKNFFSKKRKNLAEKER